MRQISENTTIKLGLAVIVIGGGAAWLTTMFVEQRAQAKAIENLSSAQSQYSLDIQAIKTGIAVIQTDIQYLKQTKGK